MSNKWWGYIHTNGSVQVKVWFNDPLDLTEARESPFVDQVFQPFEADNREDAIQQVRKLAGK